GRQKRPLLVLTGQSAPSRRFLRALVRSAPGMARQFVVATGDAIAFNNVYRDRGVAWNVQDLPVPLVFFCHHNPIDPDAGFRPLQVHAGHGGPGPVGTALFNPDGSGKRKSGTGEHIVSLRPHVQGGRVLPEATIAVWAWHGQPGQKLSEGEWRPVGEPLNVL